MSELWSVSERRRRGSLRRMLAGVVLVASMWLCCGCVSVTAVPSRGLDGESDVSTPRIAAPERWVLNNGLTVLFSRDDEIPVVSGTLFLKGGSLWEPIDEFGVSIAMGDQMRLGGAGERDPEALDQRLDELSASISSSIGQEFGRVDFACLSSDLPEVMGILSDVVRRPRFDSKRLDLWVSQRRESMRRRVDDPSTVAVVSFNQMLFGKTPYGWALTEADLGRFTRAALLKSYSRFIQPAGALLAVSGRADRATIEALVQEQFGSWRPSKADPEVQLAREALVEPPPPIAAPQTRGTFFIELPLQQATILIGQRGVPRLTPDYLAIEMFNNIFGAGGFGSRLMKKVRTEAGLAYSVYGAVVPAVTQGKNLLFIQTKTESAGAAVVRSLDELLRMQQVPVSSEELAENRAALLNSFIFNFESPEKVLIRSASFELLGYPKDYDQTYVPGVEALTPADVMEVASRRWDVGDFSMVVVGNAGALESVSEALESRAEFKSLLPIRRARFDQRLVPE